MAVTWSPTDKNAGLTLSGGDLVVTSPATAVWKTVRGNTSKSSGKWYCELTGDNLNDSYLMAGITSDGYSTADGSFAGQTNYSYAVQSGQTARYNGNVAGYSAGFSGVAPFHMSIALDLDAGTIHFWLEGVDQGQLDGIIVAGPYAISASIYNFVTSITVNFGATAFIYTPPAGYSAWDTPPGTTSDVAITAPALTLSSTARGPTVIHPTAVRNGIADFVCAQLNEGTPPGKIVYQTAGDVTVATLTFSNPAFGSASGGVATAAAIASDLSAIGGTVAKARMRNAAGTDKVICSVTAIGGGGDIQRASVVIAPGQAVALSSLTYSAPA